MSLTACTHPYFVLKLLKTTGDRPVGEDCVEVFPNQRHPARRSGRYNRVRRIGHHRCALQSKSINICRRTTPLYYTGYGTSPVLPNGSPVLGSTQLQLASAESSVSIKLFHPLRSLTCIQHWGEMKSEYSARSFTSRGNSTGSKSDLRDGSNRLLKSG